MKMNKYEQPLLDIIQLEVENVIVTSGDPLEPTSTIDPLNEVLPFGL